MQDDEVKSKNEKSVVHLSQHGMRHPKAESKAGKFGRLFQVVRKKQIAKSLAMPESSSTGATRYEFEVKFYFFNMSIMTVLVGQHPNSLLKVLIWPGIYLQTVSYSFTEPVAF